MNFLIKGNSDLCANAAISILGLQLEVANRIVAASREVVLDHSASVLLFGIAAGACYVFKKLQKS